MGGGSRATVPSEFKSAEIVGMPKRPGSKVFFFENGHGSFQAGGVLGYAAQHGAVARALGRAPNATRCDHLKEPGGRGLCGAAGLEL